MAVTRRTVMLVNDLREAISKLLAAITRNLTVGWARAWDRLAVKFSAAVKRLLDDTGGRWPSRKQVAGSKPLATALDGAVAEHDRLVQELRTGGTSAARRAAAETSTIQARIIDSQLPAGIAHHAATVSDDAVEAIVRRTGQQITARSRPLTREMRETLRRELVRGVARGLEPEQVAAQILRRLEGGFAGGLARALTIAHTEIMDAHREAARLAQAANADVLRGWIWIARLARNTCAACWVMHGSEHSLDEPGPNDHPNGRCIRAPLTKTWKELGFAYPEPDSTMPDGQAAFRAMSRADQLHVLGPGRLAALDRGDIEWSDLATRRTNPGWRDSITVTPLRDLAPT